MQPPNPGRRAVVVGARGFIGAALSATLRHDGHEVTDLLRDTPDTPWSATWDAVTSADTIFWAASTINPKIAAEHPDRVAADHHAFGKFLDALDQDESSARVVLLSSGGTVYSPSERPPHSEESPATPTSAYGRAKIALESELLGRDRRSVVVRVANAYGPGQRPAPGQGVIGHWLRALRDHETIVVLGGPEIVRDYIYIDDLTRLLALIHSSADDLPLILNAGSGTPTALSTVLQAVEDVSHEHAPAVIHHPARDFDLRESWLDISRAQQVLEWWPQVPLHEGVAAMWSWLLIEPEMEALA